MNTPSFQSYGNYSSDNYGAHTLQFFMPGLTVWFSYKTVVAFYTPDTGKVICENVWGTTTGKHLNWIDRDHSKRTPYDEFQKLLEQVMSPEVEGA